MPTLAELSTPLRHERDLTKIAGRVGDVLNARFDLVPPQSVLRFDKSMHTATLGFPEPLITESGVFDDRIDAAYTRTAMRQVCDRLNMPLSYADRLTAMENPAGVMLASHSLNELAYMDDRSALYRFLRTDEGLWLRAVLSDKYHMLDNDMALQSIMAGLGEQGLSLNDCEVEGDVTMDRLRLRIAVPDIAVNAADVLANYNMPFTMDQSRGIHDSPLESETPPVVWAGLEIANSETGNGAYSVASRIVIALCRNGMTRPIEFRRAHVGAVLEQGTIDWSVETRNNALTLITSQVGDAVRQYLSVEYVEGEVNKMREAKGIEINSPSESASIVQDWFGLSVGETTNVLDCFARGGDYTALGMGQALTAAAQLVEDGDRQTEMESMFWELVKRPQLVAS
jgi:hypothetical protein